MENLYPNPQYSHIYSALSSRAENAKYNHNNPITLAFKNIRNNSGSSNNNNSISRSKSYGEEIEDIEREIDSVSLSTSPSHNQNSHKHTSIHSNTKTKIIVPLDGKDLDDMLPTTSTKFGFEMSENSKENSNVINLINYNNITNLRIGVQI